MPTLNISALLNLKFSLQNALQLVQNQYNRRVCHNWQFRLFSQVVLFYFFIICSNSKWKRNR